MSIRRCLNCNDDLDPFAEDYCSRACELEAMYEQEATCRSCDGSGRIENVDRGDWRDCRKCQGTGYVMKRP